MFTLAISFLTTSQFTLIHGPNIPGSYAVFFLHHQSLLTTNLIHTLSLFFFGSTSSFFLEVFLHSSPVTYWTNTDLGSSYFGVVSFCLFMGFSKQEYWSGLPFTSPVDHVLSELSTMIRPSWMALHSMAHSFIELDKAVVYVIRLVSFLWLWFSSVCLLMEKDKQLMEATW